MTSCPTEPAESNDTRDPEAALNRLIDSGYRFMHPRDGAGDIVAVVGVRAHDSVVDVVRIDGEDDVTAMRVSADEADVLEPRRALWRTSGALDAVIESLLALPEDAYSGAVAGSPVGCWIPAKPGRAKYLMAS